MKRTPLSPWPSVAVWALSAALSLLVLACQPSLLRQPQRETGAPLWLAYQGTVRAQVTPLPPCGQGVVGLAGGVARRATVIESLRSGGPLPPAMRPLAERVARAERLSSGPIPLFLVDAGNFTCPLTPATRLLNLMAWKEMESLGYDAVALGRYEILNYAFLRRLLAESTLPLVTTNLEVFRDGAWQPIGERVIVVERGGLRIAFLGLLPEERLSPRLRAWPVDSLRVLPLADAVRRACDELDGQVDLVVALEAGPVPARSGPRAGDMPEIDVVIDSRGACWVAGYEDGSITWRGTSLGLACLVVSADGRLLAHGTQHHLLRDGIPVDSVQAARAERVDARSRARRDQVPARYRTLHALMRTL